VGDTIPVYLDPASFYVFDANDRLVVAPSAPGNG